MHEAQRTVNLGEDILRDTIMINFDLATMPSLFLSAIKVIMEKCQHMLDAHEVVKRLPSTAMHQQFKINSLVQVGRRNMFFLGLLFGIRETRMMTSTGKQQTATMSHTNPLANYLPQHTGKWLFCYTK